MTLNLSSNHIGPKGAKYLANALKKNNVISSSSHSIISTTYFLQTLTILNLSSNPIGDQGAQHLANALQQNKVIFSHCYSIITRYLFHVETCYTSSRFQCNRSKRSKISRQCSTTEHSKILIFFWYQSLYLLYIDTHYTALCKQSNRRRRCKTVCQYSTKKQSN